MTLLRVIAQADRLLARERGASAHEIADATGCRVQFARGQFKNLVGEPRLIQLIAPRPTRSAVAPAKNHERCIRSIAN